MTIRKLTLAAAISFGVLSMAVPSYAAQQNDQPTTWGANPGMVEDSGFVNTQCQQCVEIPQRPLPVVTGAACPMDCPCPSQCDPCATGPACPCEADPCECDPCEPCDPCDTGAACPCTPQCPAPCEPACSVCPNVLDSGYLEKQVYAYPRSIFGKSTAISADPYSMSFTQGQGGGVTVARGYPYAQTGVPVTGAAAQIPCIDDANFMTAPGYGVAADRDLLNEEGALCPIQIETPCSMKVLKKSMIPVEIQTGAAAPLTQVFCDVPNEYWASADINKLTAQNVIAGYPDRTFKPELPVSRAEFASLLINGLNIGCKETSNCPIFSDVPEHNWANSKIDLAVENGLIAGYPDNTFKPGEPVSRVEALVALSKSIQCEIDECEAEQILSEYVDGCHVPNWARLAVAKVLKAGILKDTPAPNQIVPAQDASRADIASMLSEVRVALCLDPEPTACCPTGAAAMVEQEEIITLPTLNVKMADELNPKNAHVGDKFAARTKEPVTINGVCFPVDSTVKGKVIEVIRATRNEEGGLRVAFTDIYDGKQHAKLPRAILTAQVKKVKKPNGFTRFMEWPFTWTGRTIGNIGRTAGSMVVMAGNGVEEVINGLGTATGELTMGQFRASGRSIAGSTIALFRMPIDQVRTALSGASGTINIATDEIAYVVNRNMVVSSLNSKEIITIAFGCQ